MPAAARRGTWKAPAQPSKTARSREVRLSRSPPVAGDHHDVLDAGPVPAGQVDAGLDGEGHARLQRQVVAGDDVGLLVHLQADAVAGAVDEVLAVARLR